ncbi:MAG: glutamine-hydrolyzing GMP synthase [Alphaproteobacteria bacterium]|jgi:GMP synthase (glutamine-hydrolysing)|nr:glutamine-hydrolyzing GMP synthase [Alphaproteobacteria bacterium]MBT5828035.1 glutamine-hydrolyzing GMP synthase [Alphaproteobacteria bacterium]
MTNKILIIDFGSQVTKLIARRVRDIGFYSEIFNHSITIEKVKKFNPAAIILSGGPASVNSDNAPDISSEIFNLNIPILGICYGQQLICNKLGGSVGLADKHEYGKADLNVVTEHALFSGLQNNQVWMSHGDVVNNLPTGFSVIATTSDAPYAVIANDTKKIYAMQFHPEVIHTLDGDKIIANFLNKLANLEPDWTMKNYKDIAINEIKQKVGNKKVICGVSGGVDSTVTSALISKAIGKQLTCIFVDTGLLRKNEAAEVKEIFTKRLAVNFIFIDAKKQFLSALKNVADPEQKRKIIGKTFIDIFDKEAQKIADASFLAQGTLYPDVIESSHPTGGASQTIKSHHNVGGLPEKMNLKLLEPLRELFKDEVRSLGIELNVPEDLVLRHPFPGPGLAIRMPGAIEEEKVKILQDADAIYIEEIKKHGLYNDIWQAFAVLLPVKTVGVMGDQRTYENVLALRAVTASDGMTAEYYPFEHKFLNKVASRIINEVRGINRVTYDITSKPPGTIEWE